MRRLKFICVGPCEHGGEIDCKPVTQGYPLSYFKCKGEVMYELHKGVNNPECWPDWNKLSLLYVRSFIECVG